MANWFELSVFGQDGQDLKDEQDEGKAEKRLHTGSAFHPVHPVHPVNPVQSDGQSSAPAPRRRGEVQSGLVRRLGFGYKPSAIFSAQIRKAEVQCHESSRAA